MIHIQTDGTARGTRVVVDDQEINVRCIEVTVKEDIPERDVFRTLRVDLGPRSFEDEALRIASESEAEARNTPARCSSYDGRQQCQREAEHEGIHQRIDVVGCSARMRWW